MCIHLQNQSSSVSFSNKPMIYDWCCMLRVYLTEWKDRKLEGTLRWARIFPRGRTQDPRRSWSMGFIRQDSVRLERVRARRIFEESCFSILLKQTVQCLFPRQVVGNAPCFVCRNCYSSPRWQISPVGCTRWRTHIPTSALRSMVVILGQNEVFHCAKIL